MIGFTIFDVISYYITILEEEYSMRFRALKADLKRMKTFPDDDKIKKSFYNELKQYFEALKIEKSVCKYLMLNNHKLMFNDVFRTIDKLDEEGEKKLFYISDLIDLLSTACDLDLNCKFYIPRNKPIYILDVNEYINVAKGFTLDGVKDFLINERVYTDLTFNATKGKIKNLNVIGGDAKYYAGVYKKGIVLPTVKDDVTALIAVHELVHNALIINRNAIRDNSISNGEVLPILYEYLYADYNRYVSTYIHENEEAAILHHAYNGEPLFVQVEKLKELRKIR